jgi:hypothetical protein
VVKKLKNDKRTQECNELEVGDATETALTATVPLQRNIACGIALLRCLLLQKAANNEQGQTIVKQL